MPKPGDEKIVHTVCSSHCGGACPIQVHVKDGVISRIEGDGGETPQFRACLRGRAYRQRVYSPDRLLHPLKRTGKRGEGNFTRISWDEALEIMAGEMRRIRDTYGPAAILFFCSGGDQHALHHHQIINRLLCQFGGYTAPWGYISYEGATFSATATYGTVYGTAHTVDDYLNSKLIIMWGWNPTSTIHRTGTAWYLAQAKEKGIKIVSVDPRYTDSAAAFATRWIPIRPGTDTAMLAAMAYVMIEENLHDQRFIDTYTAGFEKYRDYIMGIEDGVAKTPEWAEAITGVPALETAQLAREYACTKPAAFVAGIAPGRTAYGEQYHRAASVLTAMTGNIGIHGGSPADRCWNGESWGGETLGISRRTRGSITSPPNPVEGQAPPRWNTLSGRSKGTRSSVRVNVAMFADAILRGKSGGYSADYKFLWLANTNYLNQICNVKETERAFQQLDFLVVMEQFMTPTAKFADLILPVCTYLERNDFGSGGATPFFGLVNKAIEPLGESKSHFDICTALAAKLGIDDFTDKSEEEWLKSIVDGLAEVMDFPYYEKLQKQPVHKVQLEAPIIAFQKEIEDPRNNPFPTPSGKIEIYSARVADMNHPKLPPIPKYIATWESRKDPLARKYPLQMISSHCRRRAHSQFDNIPWLKGLMPQAVTMSSVDAENRGVKTGDSVRVFNERGQMIITARVTERIMPGVVDIPQGAWYAPDANGIDQGGCANVLTRNTISPAGAFPSNTALVQVEKV
ncbi:molybdopterin-dependent oxidoreductase [Thermodesulfobacteriota bacterium]